MTQKDGSIQNEDLRQFLSNANPFLWAGLNSADPAMFPEFCSIVQQEEIPLEDSYKTLQNTSMLFRTITLMEFARHSAQSLLKSGLTV